MKNKILGWSMQNIKSLFGFIATNPNVALINNISAWSAKNNKQPYSVRNFFYKLLNLAKTDKTVCKKLLNQGVDLQSFLKPSNKEEQTKALLTKILDYREKRSVACVCLQLANNNPQLAQKLQNKYRNTISCHPEIVQQVISDLHNQGIPTRITFARQNILPMPEQHSSQISEQDLQSLVFGVINLIRKNAEANIRTRDKKELQQTNNHLQKALIDNRRKDVMLAELKAENEKIKQTLLETKHLQQKMQAERNANYLTIKGLIESKKQKALQNFVLSLLPQSQENTTLE